MVDLIQNRESGKSVRDKINEIIAGFNAGPYPFEARADLVAFAGERTPALGAIANAGGVSYRYTGIGSIIPDLPGWVPHGDATPDHWAENVAPGTTDMAAAVNSALTSGYAIVKLRPAVYSIPTVYVTLTNDVTLDMCGGTIKGAAGADADKSILIIDATTSNRYRFEMRGGTIDGTTRTYNPGVASGSGVEVKYSDDPLITDMQFYSGESRTSGFGDSGIVISSCKRSTVTDSWFRGWNDHGIYCTGGSVTNTHRASEDLTVSGCTFSEVSGAVRFAREHIGCTVTDNTFVDVYNGVILGGGNTNWKTARDVIVSNNRFVGCDASAIDLRYIPATYAAVVQGNIIYDWALTTTGPAINLRGVSNALVIGNTARPLLATTANATACTEGIYVQTSPGELGDDNPVGEGDGTTYVAGNNRIISNSILVLERGVTSGSPTSASNYCVRDLSNSQNNIIQGNGFNPAPYDVYINNGGSNGTVGATQVRRQTLKGLGLHGVDPQESLDTAGKLRASRSSDPLTQYLEIHHDGSARFTSRSEPTAAKAMEINATTDATNSAVTGGVLAMRLRVRNILRLVLPDTGDVEIRPDSASSVVIGDPSTGGKWNTSHLKLGPVHLWVDASNRLRIKASTPLSDTDGTVVGAQV